MNTLKPHSKMPRPPKIYNANLKVPGEVMSFHIETGKSEGKGEDDEEDTIVWTQPDKDRQS